MFSASAGSSNSNQSRAKPGATSFFDNLDLIPLVAIARKDKPSGWFKSNWVG
jgi:hypothetical protein